MYPSRPTLNSKSINFIYEEFPVSCLFSCGDEGVEEWQIYRNWLTHFRVKLIGADLVI